MAVGGVSATEARKTGERQFFFCYGALLYMGTSVWE